MQAIIEDKAKEPGFTNSVVFNLVMRRNPDLCKEVVETALGFELSKISYIETEKTIQPKLTSKNVRLDVVAKADGKMIDIEMQVAYEPSLARRARYYESAMDTDALKSGISYHELPESYVIFFCKGAPFGKGCAERRFAMMDALHPTEKMTLDDGRTIVVLSAGNWAEVESPSLSKLLKYIHTGNVDDGSDDLTSRLENAVRELREDEDNMGYMHPCGAVGDLGANCKRAAGRERRAAGRERRAAGRATPAAGRERRADRPRAIHQRTCRPSHFRGSRRGVHGGSVRRCRDGAPSQRWRIAYPERSAESPADVSAGLSYCISRGSDQRTMKGGG